MKMKTKIRSQIYFAVSLALILHPGWFAAAHDLASSQQSVAPTPVVLNGGLSVSNLAQNQQLAFRSSAISVNAINVPMSGANCLATGGNSADSAVYNQLQPAANLAGSAQPGAGESSDLAQNVFALNPDTAGDCIQLSLGRAAVQERLAVTNSQRQSVQIFVAVAKGSNLYFAANQSSQNHPGAMPGFAAVQSGEQDFQLAAKTFSNLSEPSLIANSTTNLAMLSIWRC
jgi:hypothetical protein